MEIGPLSFNADTAPEIPSATEDTDGDGRSDFEEYAFATEKDVPDPSRITYSIDTVGEEEYFKI